MVFLGFLIYYSYQSECFFNLRRAASGIIDFERIFFFGFLGFRCVSFEGDLYLDVDYFLLQLGEYILKLFVSKVACFIPVRVQYGNYGRVGRLFKPAYKSLFENYSPLTYGSPKVIG